MTGLPGGTVLADGGYGQLAYGCASDHCELTMAPLAASCLLMLPPMMPAPTMTTFISRPKSQVVRSPLLSRGAPDAVVVKSS